MILFFYDIENSAALKYAEHDFCLLESCAIIFYFLESQFPVTTTVTRQNVPGF